MHPEYLRRHDDRFDEPEASVLYGERYINPESARIHAKPQFPEIPLHNATTIVARGHADYLRRLGMRITCIIPYGSAFDCDSPGLRNVQREGFPSDVDYLFVFQTKRQPKEIEKYFLPRQKGFLYQTHIKLPPNAFANEVAITGVSLLYLKYLLTDILHFLDKRKSQVVIHTPAGNRSIPFEIALDKQLWIIRALQHTPISGHLPSKFVNMYTSACEMLAARHLI